MGRYNWRVWKYYLLLLLTVTLTAASHCPKDYYSRSNACLTDYSIQLSNIRSNQLKLLTGIDVEAVRALCSAFLKALRCVDDLKSKCNRNQKERMEMAMINLSQTQDELNKLCKDDRIYERYALYHSCFLRASADTESCFSKFINKSVNIFTKLKYASKHELCNSMKRVYNCIEVAITRKCNRNAAKLVEYLLTPMVKDSAQCTFKQQPTTTTTTRATTPVRIIVQADQRDSNRYPNGSGVRSSFSLYLAFLLATFCIWSWCIN